MKVAVSKWGNSASVRIPAPFMEALQLKLRDQVEVSIENGRVIIEPIRETDEFDLQVLIAQLTPENLHGEIDFGAPQGNESL